MQLRGFKDKGEQRPADNKNDLVRQAMDKYSGYDEDALINALIKNIKDAKDRGTYNAAEIKTFTEMLSPKLSEKQRIKLRNIINLIENENV